MAHGARGPAILLSTLLLGLPVLAPAQVAAPAAAASASVDPMERARRDAANPMRRILEAASIERARLRAREREAPPSEAPSAPPSTRVDPPTPPDTGIRVKIERLPAPEPQMVSPVIAPLSAPARAAVAEAAPAATEPVVPAGLPVVRLGDAPASRPPASPRPPVLVSMVEPAIPPHLLDGLRADEAVGVRLTIGVDGRVTEVELDPAAPKGLTPFVREALLQWRYDAADAERQHRIDLVLK